MRKGGPLAGQVVMMRYVGSFISDDMVLENLRAGRAQARLRDMREVAVRNRWKRLLVFGGSGCPQIRDVAIGSVRPAARGDVNADGIYRVDLDYVNRLWRLHLCMGPLYPLDVLCDFLDLSPVY